MQFAQEQREKAGLAAAIGADDAHLLACVQRKVEAFEQCARAACEGEIAEGDQGKNQLELYSAQFVNKTDIFTLLFSQIVTHGWFPANKIVKFSKK